MIFSSVLCLIKRNFDGQSSHESHHYTFCCLVVKKEVLCNIVALDMDAYKATQKEDRMFLKKYVRVAKFTSNFMHKFISQKWQQVEILVEFHCEQKASIHYKIIKNQ